MTAPLAIGLDQGTGSTKALAIDGDGTTVARAAAPIGIAHPRPGWSEHDPEDIWSSVRTVLSDIAGDIDGAPIAAIGISNQRESAMVWDRHTGAPLSTVVGWQDTRTADMTAAYADRSETIQRLTGLPVNPMFSAMKFSWLLDRIDPDRERAAAGDLVCGTVDAWLVYRLTGEIHIEASNASRTQLFALDALDWDDDLLDWFNVPRSSLPPVSASSADVGVVQGLNGFDGVPVRGVLGDSHAALYGHGVRQAGDVKATLGTGSSVMAIVGDRPVGAGAAGAETLAWLGERPTYALEGNILAAGATVEWCARLLGLTPTEIFARAERVDPAPVDLVPAFAGLGAPWWQPEARSIIAGFGLGDDIDALCIAAVDSIALQVIDVVDAIDQRLEGSADALRVDGGIAANDWFVQRLADLLQRPVVRPAETGLSALGAAQLAGTAAGLFAPDANLTEGRSDTFEPTLASSDAHQRRDRWHRAVDLAQKGNS